MSNVHSPLKFSYDEQADVLMIEGMRYSGQLFRAFAEGGLELGSVFQVESRDGGVLCIKRLDQPQIGRSV